MFDWLGDILSGLGDALSVVFEGVGADIAVDIWNALVEWIYNTVFDAVADLFTSMNNMGAEIFSLSWVNAVVRLFTLFGWHFSRWGGRRCVRGGYRVAVRQGQYQGCCAECAERLLCLRADRRTPGGVV